MSKESINENLEVEWTLKNNSRKQLRDLVVNKFLEEKGGYWKKGVKYVTHYKYFVEKLSDGRRIFLLRPTYLNKGIDFQVWIEKFDGFKDDRPSHGDIFKDLKAKQEENQKSLGNLLDAIDAVWICEEPDEVLRKFKDLKFKTGFSIEMILKILKWLFIEQDITYWNYDGRGMLRMEINKRLQIQENSQVIKNFFNSV